MSAGLAYVMKDSLTPTVHDCNGPISPANYPDKKSMVNAFKRMVCLSNDPPVHISMDSHDDRTKLHEILKDFHRTLVVEDLMEQLHHLLNPPQKRKLYLAIRPLIPARVRAEYNSLIPHIPSYEKKFIHLKQAGPRSMGFKIRGGIEFGCGIYVSSLQPSSRSCQAGLKVGDEIVRINGLILSESTHEEVVNIIKLKKSLTLTVKCVGMLPEQDVIGNIKWKTVEERKVKGHVHPMKKLSRAILRSTKKIQVTLNAGQNLGASVKSSSDKASGIFISELVPNSIAHEQGLKIGDELIEVNGESLINVPHRQAISMLKSSESLMLTIRNKDPTVTSQLGYDPLSNPPEDFEMNPHDIDMDAELIPTNNTSYGFFLRTKDQGSPGDSPSTLAEEKLRQKRLSLTDMDTEWNKNAPIIASPAAIGFGPSVAMPALLGMMPEFTDLDDEMDEEGKEDRDEDDMMRYLEGLSPQQVAAVTESMAFPDLSQHRDEVRLDSSFFVSPQNALQQMLQQQQQQAILIQSRPPMAPKPTTKGGSKVSGTDLTLLYHSPVDDGDTHPDTTPTSREITEFSSSWLQEEGSAISKDVARKKAPYFQEKDELIIGMRETPSNNRTDTLEQTVHTSNMEFSERVLQGRSVAFHSVPKDGPIKIAIRGGTDTPLGGAIIISRILEGGAADRFGHLNVGDQILVVNGVNLIDVTHDEAAQYLKKAMDMDSRSIDLVVAVNPDATFQCDDRPPSHTVWPPQEDTVCDNQPEKIVRGHDCTKQSRHSHSGFSTWNDKEEKVHYFMPNN